MYFLFFSLPVIIVYSLESLFGLKHSFLHILAIMVTFKDLLKSTGLLRRMYTCAHVKTHTQFYFQFQGTHSLLYFLKVNSEGPMRGLVSHIISAQKPHIIGHATMFSHGSLFQNCSPLFIPNSLDFFVIPLKKKKPSKIRLVL